MDTTHLERVLDYLNEEQVEYFEEEYMIDLPEDIDEAIAKIEELNLTHEVFYSVLRVRRSLIQPVHETENTPET